MSTTPQIKFENSPADSLADSFISTPGTQYPSLFANNTLDPVEALTPRSYEDDSMFGGSVREDSVLDDSPEGDKKQVKKRKSWGQQLPEPKTNLPPRKRAKTEDEKEQRRVERVLRNRRAAQSSRERKRQEVEALEAEKRQIERRNQDLEMRLAHMEEQYARVTQELAQVTGNKMHVFGSSSAVSSPSQELRQASPVTFSQELFSSRDSNPAIISRQSVSEPHSLQTVNPASLSPEIRPVDDLTNASSSDMTQHPAAMLCDLQCQSEEQRPWTNTPTTTASAISQILIMTTFLNMISASTSALLSPLSQINTSLRTGSVLSPTASILTLITWLTTTIAPLTKSTSMTSSTTTTSLRPRFTLRISMLRRLLACSPNLARPLMDATVVAMRSASEQQLTDACLSGVDASVRHVGESSPSVESLMTLLWAIHVIEEEREQKEKAPKLDAATEVRQACGKLDEMFRPRNVTQKKVSYLSRERGNRALGEKSSEDWRTEFKNHRS
ncbi:Transcriptional activator hac1 [Lachnellula cervina]|uniref:Transcriptional activator hac1 n=1 Tax=Lachnellula cervina TaxID=1316786 RepID=A0A7D8YVX8_9HELO|nr:Transcriptional activator hac1 [Lachnellula cervina]